ncbi:MAG: 4a-hydroxytetrahydrobiopterin dehydratase [Acidobacteriaceae bacterium]
MQNLSPEAIQDHLSHLPEWKLDEGRLVRDFKFADFVHAMIFVNSVAELAEAVGHHPDIDIRYNQVRLGLVSHDAGGITERDVEMAASLDQRYGLSV